MQPATSRTVLGDFSGVRFEHRGEVYRFVREGEQFRVEYTPAGAAPGSAPQVHRVAYTFGVAPLQQYLLETPSGRLQSLTIAWDTKRERWYTLYPDETIPDDDALHWQGRMQNWNAMCADCHSTRLDRGYDPATDGFKTTWSAIDVGCQSCHGPGSGHLEQLKDGNTEAPTKGRGFAVDLLHRSAREQVDDCGRCHSRRRSVSELFQHGDPLLDHFVPSTLDEGLYHPDGQILDEVYVWGSFTQSRMYAAGVRCSDCHDPHSLAPRAEGNALCTQCHSQAPPSRFPSLVPGRYDDGSHHHHAPGDAGSACVDCHMPERTYMQIDGRRDHSLRIPRPDRSVRIGTPNACNACHTNRSATWAAKQVETLWGPSARRVPSFGELFFDARRGEASTLPGLRRLVNDTTQPAIVRATAVRLAAGFGADAADIVRAGITDDEALVRVVSLSALLTWPPAARVPLAGPALDDPVRAVRVEAARVLAGLRSRGLEPDIVKRLDPVLAELRTGLESAAALPGVRMNLATVDYELGELAAAEAGYRAALAFDPRFLPARINLVYLFDAEGRVDDAIVLLREGLEVEPTSGDLHYTLGLVLSGQGRMREAETHFEQALEAQPGRARWAYNLGLARQHLGDVAGARAALERARALDPQDPDIARAMAIFFMQRGDPKAAWPHAAALVRLAPGDRDAQALMRQIEQALGSPSSR